MCEDQLPLNQRGIATLDKFEHILDDLIDAARLAAHGDVKQDIEDGDKEHDEPLHRYLSLLAALASRIEAKMIVELYGRGEELAPEVTSMEMLARCCAAIEDNVELRLKSIVGLMFLAKDFTVPTALNVREHYKNLTSQI